MDVYHWPKYLQDLVIKIVGLERKIRVFRCFLALHHSILWVFEYLIQNGFIDRGARRSGQPKQGGLSEKGQGSTRNRGRTGDKNNRKLSCKECRRCVYTTDVTTIEC